MVGCHVTPPSVDRGIPPTCTLARRTPPAVAVSDRTYGLRLPTACQSSRPSTASNPGMGSNRFSLKTRVSDGPQPTIASSARESNAPWIPSDGSGDCTVSACRQPPLARYTTVSPSKIAQSSLSAVTEWPATWRSEAPSSTNKPSAVPTRTLMRPP